ncbi:two-component system response regulator [Corallincola luteus]|uniref:Response regulator n=2 Tax=Corallincola TaxID=1775176 RepID=A0A368NM15_9GAMM|nr:response regulator [Corallincola holothuriorum]TCI04005.1 two-component system response regulator [Corallincola luteus]
MKDVTNDKATILVVDDTPENIDVLAGLLRDDYNVKAAKNGEIALKIAHLSPPPELILLDIMMPGIDGYEVCRRLKEDPVTKHIPVIFVTAKISPEDELRGLELGAVDYITKPISPPIVKARVKTQLALFNQNRELDRKVKEQTATIAETRQKVIERLGRAAEYKDNETGMHVVRMSHYSRILAVAVGMNEADADLLKAAAPMHDIGKIGIPDRVLQKPGKLDAEEWEVMQSHAVIGGEILGDDESELLKLAKLVALTHHEKWNGKGYPNGLAGEDIPLEGRIVAIADVFDALTSERPYKKGWSVEDAIALLEKEAGEHFDPRLVKLFVAELPKVLEVKASFSD